MRVDPSYVNNLVNALDNTQANEQTYSAQLSSGVRVNSLSDDPMAAGENVRLLDKIQQDDSFTQTTSLVTGQLQVADSALGQVVSQVTQAISLATSANNGSLSSSDIQSISNQLTGIRAEVVALANTSYQGTYIFGGGVTGSSPFSAGSGTTVYSGGATVNYLTTPNGQKIQLNVAGDQMFMGSDANNLMGALDSLIADYSSGTVNAQQAATDTANLGTALNYVSSQRVVLDNALTQLTAASTALQSEQTQLTSTQTTLMQADVANVATKLSLAETQTTALESVIAALGSGSLFDKL